MMRLCAYMAPETASHRRHIKVLTDIIVLEDCLDMLVSIRLHSPHCLSMEGE